MDFDYKLIPGKEGTIILYLNGVFNGTYDNYKEAYYELVKLAYMKR